MQYGQIKNILRPVSRFVFGTAHPVFFKATRSDHGEEAGFPQALEEAFRLLDEVYALGVNILDCSAHYGEEPVGEWLAARGLQGQVLILTKGAHHNAWRKRVTPYDILSDAYDSLAKLGVDTIDIYLLHRDDPTQPVGPIMEALDSLVSQDKARVIGVSNWELSRIQEANEYARKHGLAPLGANSPHYGLARQLTDVWGGGCQTITGEDNRQAREWFIQQKMPIFAYSSLARGLFSGKVQFSQRDRLGEVLDDITMRGYVDEGNLKRLERAEIIAREKGATVPQIALAWMTNQPLDVYPVISSSNARQMRANIAAGDIRLTPGEVAWLDLQREDRG
ncbi:MAG: aldo/keto reductase [Eubacteriales bacterium]|nr:aldo/keto reductase [Eubacteriales bacterium]